MVKLDTIFEKLKNSENVSAAFLTGSYKTLDFSEHSDIDLVIILKENKENLRSIYKFVDGYFADIFVFDLKDLARIAETKSLKINSMDAVFLDWVRNSTIIFDKTDDLRELKSKVDFIQFVGDDLARTEAWRKINYNYIANNRYFTSGKQKYIEALEIRLLYSVMELLTGYLEFRNIPWRGEKNAVRYLEGNAKDFYSAFGKYKESRNITDRFNAYIEMVNLVFREKYQKWDKDFILVLDKDFNIVEQPEILNLLDE